MFNDEPVEMHGEEASRAEAERHIAEHSLGEAARIGRLPRIREFVLGAQDGLPVPLAEAVAGHGRQEAAVATSLAVRPARRG